MSSQRASRPSLLLVGLCVCVIMLLLVWPAGDVSLGGDHFVHLAWCCWRREDFRPR